MGLIKNIDYYEDNDRIIFTHLFHIKRGQCCGNGCRHCPFDPKYKKNNTNIAKEFFLSKKFFYIYYNLVMDLEQIKTEIENINKELELNPNLISDPNYLKKLSESFDRALELLKNTIIDNGRKE